MRRLAIFLSLLLLTNFRLWASTEPVPEFCDLSGQTIPASPAYNLPIEENPTPFLHFYPLRTGASKGLILILPGGAYHKLAMVHDGVNVASDFNSLGYDAVILAYRTNQGRDLPLKDAQTALTLLQTRGTDWGLNVHALSIIGFSADGHLAAHLLHELGPQSPFQNVFLVYPAYLNGTNGAALDPVIVPPTPVSSRVCLMIGDQDSPGWIAGAQAYAKLLQNSGCTVEFHLLPNLRHGFRLKNPTPPSPAWDFVNAFLAK